MILFHKTWHKLSCAPCMVRHLVYKQYLRKYYSYNKNKNIPRCAKDCSFKWYHEKPWKQLQNCVSKSLSFFLGHPIDKHVHINAYISESVCRTILFWSGRRVKMIPCLFYCKIWDSTIFIISTLTSKGSNRPRENKVLL